MRIDDVAGFGQIVAGRREGLGLSQAALAARAGVSRSWISRVETGAVDPGLSTVLALAAALDLTVSVSNAAPDRAAATTSSVLDDLVARSSGWSDAEEREAGLA